MSNKAVSVYAEAFKRQQQEAQPLAPESTPQSPPQPTRPRTPAREPPREITRDFTREQPRETTPETQHEQAQPLPTRDEIQEFSFRLRDELNVKVQAEVPHHWQKDFEEVARDLNVKKLELYRFILGEFLGKVRRKQRA